MRVKVKVIVSLLCYCFFTNLFLRGVFVPERVASYLVCFVHLVPRPAGSALLFLYPFDSAVLAVVGLVAAVALAAAPAFVVGFDYGLERLSPLVHLHLRSG